MVKKGQYYQLQTLGFDGKKRHYYWLQILGFDDNISSTTGYKF